MRRSLRANSEELRAVTQLIIALMIDREGLQVAYLGVALAHYLDLETGEIIDLPFEDGAPGSAERYRRIPARSEASETLDRELFLETKHAASLRDELAAHVHDAHAYRQVLSQDRRAERSFFNFKNDRASEAIEAWLVTEGLA